MVREQTFEKLYSLNLHGFVQALQQQLADSRLVSSPRIGGLHHRYDWRQAA